MDHEETKQITEDLLHIFQRQEKNLALLQQTRRLFEKVLDISTMEHIDARAHTLRQNNKVLHNRIVALRDRYPTLNQAQNNLAKD